MVLMVRSIGITLSLLQRVFFSLLMLLSTFAVYCIEGKASFSKEMTLYQQQQNVIFDPSQKEKNTSSNSIPNDLVPTNLVLVSTMDGSLRGIDRYHGNVHWTLKGGPGSSLIKSTSKFETHNKQGTISESKDSSDEESDEKLFMDTMNDITTDPDDSDDLYEDPEFNMDPPWETNEEEGDIYYIIEPQDGGIIYLYSDGRPLEKLPFSVEQIVSESPFRTPDGTTYIGKKSTLMVEIDPKNGKILQQFDINKVDDFCMGAPSKYSSRTIFLGRNGSNKYDSMFSPVTKFPVIEYKVSMYDENHKKLWSVTYSEYIPNKFDWDVPASSIPTDIYIAPDASQAITGVNVENGDPIWSINLPHPVVSVFDVFRREDYTFAVTKQSPPQSLTKGAIGDMLSVMIPQNNLSTAYVGVHDGSLYALSTQNYPMVHVSQWSSMYTGRDTKRWIDGSTTASCEWVPKPPEMCCHGCDDHAECLVGQHRVQSIMDDVVDEGHFLYHHSKIYLPSASHSNSSPTSTPTDLQSSLPSGDYGYDDERKTSLFHDGIGKFWKSYVLVSSVIVYVYRDRVQTFYEVKVLPRWKKMMKKRARAKKARARIAAAAKAEEERIRRERSDSITSLESFDDVKEKSKSRRKKAVVVANSSDDSDSEREDDEEEVSDSKVPIVKKSGLDLENFKQSKSKVLEISDEVLGYGSHGTVVYKGTFDGRSVAVKRLLLDFYDVALQEVKLLQESDDHPNVVRYFYKEESDRFLYIALELCFGSLTDYMERTLPIPDMHLCDTMNPANILFQITSGLQYLHSLKIVHRDIKPHNILLAPCKNRFAKDLPQTRVLISDFGLCKRLDGEQSSFNYTAASPAGTSGWRAPELLAGALAATPSDTSLSSSLRDTSDPNMMMGRVKATRAIDIFSAGCVFYYVLSGGEHPFGNRFGRENNILLGNYDLGKLDSMAENSVEAKDLVERMISTEPKKRPKSDTIALHPFFWSPAKKLSFLQDASDRFEIEERDPPSPLLQELESNTLTVIGTDWYKRIDRIVANDLGKFRKYDGKRIRDLLRALRNKKHHWQDIPEAAKKIYGEPPGQFLYYFTTRFPHLLLHTYYVVANHPDLRKEGSLGQYF